MIRSLSLVISLGLSLGFALGGFADPASAGRSLNGTSLDGVTTIERSGGCDEWGCGTNGTSVDGVALAGCSKFICGDNGTAVDGVARLERVPGGCEDVICGENGTRVDGVTPRASQRCVADATAAPRPAAREVVLPSGERIELR